MLLLQKYKNKRIAIYGMGKTGLSAAKTFQKMKAKLYCWDDNKNVRKKIKKLSFNVNKFWKENNLIDVILLSPGIDINKCRIKNFLKKNINKVITDLDLFFEFNKKATMISITGTNGKSTTCKILEKVLKTAKYKVKTVGNIGSPILYSKEYKKKYFLILEVSSYQLQYSKLFRSRHAAILNISSDHLERHKNINNYTRIKSKIFFAQKKNDYAYVNYNNKYTKIIKDIFNSKKIKSSLILVKKSENLNFLKKIDNKYFRSGGNIENLIFAYRIAKNLNINEKIIIKAVNKFKGLPHRQEIVFSRKNLLCINDSKATSFDASLQSLLNYKNIYWIVGGLPKLKDHYNIKEVKKNVLKAYIIGKHTSFFRKKISNYLPCIISKNIQNAINDVIKDIKLNNNLKSTILLSPAAASFDQFSNFENRGVYFKNLIVKKFKSLQNV